MRIVSLLVLSLAVCAGVIVSGGDAVRAAGTPLYYVSLGDSLSVGEQPDKAGQGIVTDEGFSDQLFTLLRARMPGLQLVKLGCPGETTGTMLDGTHCAYPRGSQLAEAVAFLEANRPSIAYVTISVGANDALACASDDAIDVACATGVFDAVPRNLAMILGAIRAAAGPGVPVAGMTLYNTLLRGWLDGPAGQQQAREMAPLAALYSRTLADAYRSGGALVADVAAAFDSEDFTTIVDVPGFGGLPLNVARICTWTWLCVPPPVGPNIHANREGYGVIAQVFAAAFGLSSPS
jgi:lysophospholipase L1-like esterase